MKPVVHYKRLDSVLVVGSGVYVFPVDHPSSLVSNESLVRTSPVVRVGENGEFETNNTVYKPVE